MKPCFKCGEVKPLVEFYKHPMMVDGHVNKCKECNKRDVRENRRANVDYYRAYDRARGSRTNSSYLREYRAKSPAKYKAKTAIGNALRDRKITKDVLCQYCGAYRKLHGHHCDYDKPLDVQWLCVPCHKQWHLVNGEGLNGETE